MTRILDILEKKNLIIRIPHDKDRRKLKIYITQEGRSIVGNLIPAAEDLQLNIKMNISKHEFDQLKEILGRAHQNALNIR
jgi:DNA-binding MarR family transcriptional regulator